MNDFASQIHFVPLVPMLWIWVLSAGIFLLSFLSIFRFRHGVLFRFFVSTLLIGVLLNPSLLEEERIPAKDVMVIIVDRSSSQNFGDRMEQTDEALVHLKERISQQGNTEIRVIETSERDNNSRETRLFSALNSALSDVPKTRRAGSVFITDGQVHDVPQDISIDAFGPIHTLLTGESEEYDRRIVVTNAPAYGITGQSIRVTFMVEDSRSPSGARASVVLRDQDGAEEFLRVMIGKEYSVDVPITHAGQNIFEITTEEQTGELTHINNRTVVLVHGVRDRLKVLLVSGKPHIGERTWRNLLTSDPGVDLVHFTILREINKLDRTPQNELSLIPFPFQELFEVKLYDFDLIIFDNYRQNRILPDRYFDNIVRYVHEGGALLEASGGDYSDNTRSTYSTPLHQILPATPQNSILDRAFVPQRTQKGKQHPVTRDLQPRESGHDWGPWFRQNRVQAKSGDILMRGGDQDNNPLLILDRVGKGRVAQFSSDNLWLWAKGYKNGGPHAELSRRIIHWLMKEPELDEEAMNVSVHDHDIIIRMQNYERTNTNITMVKPDGTVLSLSLQENGAGWFEKKIHAEQNGIYSFQDKSGQKKFAVIGSFNPPEMRDVLSTADKMRPIADKSKGHILRLSEHENPSIRFMPGRKYTGFGGRNWIGLRQNNDYNIASVRDTRLLTPWMTLLILLSAFGILWWAEGRKL